MKLLVDNGSKSSCDLIINSNVESVEEGYLERV